MSETATPSAGSSAAESPDAGSTGSGRKRRSPWPLAFGIAAGVTAVVALLVVSLVTIVETGEGQMFPLLRAGDRVLALRGRGHIERGTVVAIRRDGRERVFRVVALPGDEVTVTDGIVRFGDRVLERCALGSYIPRSPELAGMDSAFALELNDKQAYLVATPLGPTSGVTATFRLKAGELLVLGDHRGGAVSGALGPDGGVVNASEVVAMPMVGGAPVLPPDVEKPLFDAILSCMRKPKAASAGSARPTSGFGTRR